MEQSVLDSQLFSSSLAYRLLKGQLSQLAYLIAFPVVHVFFYFYLWRSWSLITILSFFGIAYLFIQLIVRLIRPNVSDNSD